MRMEKSSLGLVRKRLLVHQKVIWGQDTEAEEFKKKLHINWDGEFREFSLEI